MQLRGARVAVLVADGFEQRELDAPVDALRAAGATVEILAPDPGHLRHIQGLHHFELAPGTAADRTLGEASPDEYDGLLIPGGCISPDTMRQSPMHLAFVRDFVRSGKPTAVICHGAWLLADAGVATGRMLTSWPGIRCDLERAGAVWVDQEVARDLNLITSRSPADLPAFNQAFVQALAAAHQPA